ncbi:MAG: ClpXP protease specificity-enhancing factor [Proteobacteria bacterium]|nr:ClpXP protease specificity-enhancing factor [Pseudomonadota bacterium]
MSSAADSPSSTKPYLLRALYEWCTDNGFTPFLAVHVDGQVRVPREHVKNGEIVLNISFGATGGLKISNEDVRFKARFGGVAREIMVPISHVTAIYARENGQGMAFPLPELAEDASDDGQSDPAATSSSEASASNRLHAVPDTPAQATAEEESPPPEPPPRPSGSHLKRVK